MAHLPEQKKIEGLGGNMRLGGQDVDVLPGTLAAELFAGSEDLATGEQAGVRSSGLYVVRRAGRALPAGVAGGEGRLAEAGGARPTVLDASRSAEPGAGRSPEPTAGRSAELAASDSIGLATGWPIRIRMRFRHRYEVDPRYVPVLEKAGLVFSGRHPTQPIMQILELPRSVHPFFIGTQAHPCLTSRPLHPHPMFTGLVAAALKAKKG